MNALLTAALYLAGENLIHERSEDYISEVYYRVMRSISREYIRVLYLLYIP